MRIVVHLTIGEKDKLIALKNELETKRELNKEISSAKYASSAKSSKRPRTSINTGHKKTDLSTKVQRKELRFNRANDRYAPIVEIDLLKVLTKTPIFLENDSIRSFFTESVCSLGILPLNMAKIELEKAKAIALR
ncbi:uncharacterized protein LOC112460111 [Temnothorax curvispinosus]|uniref:Uncharacterized protein LOC112460111 n=1 Tax=Temnothorax curvispinosus TaxID=300111 RepID=A0A6J1QDJ3_9HYME|nr:uncharacterized protein LOC112460111 [Temnothorax curvispinosus]